MGEQVSTVIGCPGTAVRVDLGWTLNGWVETGFIDFSIEKSWNQRQNETQIDGKGVE